VGGAGPYLRDVRVCTCGVVGWRSLGKERELTNKDGLGFEDSHNDVKMFPFRCVFILSILPLALNQS